MTTSTMTAVSRLTDTSSKPNSRPAEWIRRSAAARAGPAAGSGSMMMGHSSMTAASSAIPMTPM